MDHSLILRKIIHWLTYDFAQYLLKSLDVLKQNFMTPTNNQIQSYFAFAIHWFIYRAMVNCMVPMGLSFCEQAKHDFSAPSLGYKIINGRKFITSEVAASSAGVLSVESVSSLVLIFSTTVFVINATSKPVNKISVEVIKGTGHDFFWPGTPMNHFQKQEKIHINQKKQQNPCKIVEIMKKTGLLASFILGGALRSGFLIS